MKKNLPRMFGVVLCLFALYLTVWPAVARSTAPEQTSLRDVWRRVHDSGAYHFSADIVQTTTPRPTVLNVGRESKREEAHLEGQTSLPDQSLHLTLWSQGGSVLDSGTGIELKAEGGSAFARQANQPWQPVNDFTGMFAPEGDFMAYLSAAQDVTQEKATRDTAAGPLTFTRYAFRIDGQGYATFMRDQLEKQLAVKGELPVDAKLDLPKVYAGVTGRGELWVGENGLPIRQILNLEFPERPDDNQVTAQVTVDFSDFRPIAPAAAWAPFRLPALTADDLQRGASAAVVTALVLGLTAVIIVYGRSKKLYGAVAVSMCLLMVITPLLQHEQAAAFAERQTARADEQKAREQESDMARTLQAMQTKSDFNSYISPLEQARAKSAMAAPKSALGLATTTTGDSGQTNLDDPLCADSVKTQDADGDGLLNGEECILGTLPDVADSDNDGLSDYVEVNGFVVNGVRRYTNPTQADTNHDGMTDGQEWYGPGYSKSNTPPDTDGDGVPDLFDEDNDGDGVPDNLDLSPYSKSSTFSSASPFEFVISNLTANKPAMVQFQLRPTNPDHLQFAMNVLDWPVGDTQGQMQDEDGKAFYDVDTSLPRNPNDNGDVRLVPMLEVRITGSPTNLPPQSTLDFYGISTNNLPNGNTAAYVPLQIVMDNKGNRRVAFSGRMPYLPGATWGNAHQARLVWLVQALVDVCDTYADGQCSHYSKYNDLQVIQTYDDTWFLTGFSVREEHGTDMAIIYEDPDPDPDLNSDDVLMTLLYGLDNSFLAGRDCDTTDTQGNCVGDSKRDITINEIWRRFDHSVNSGVPISPTRWNISPNILTVVTQTFPTADQSLFTTSVTNTKSILNGSFTPYWSTSAPISPTLMFAREERFRGLNMDVSQFGSLNVTWSGLQLSLNLPTGGDDPIKLQVLAGLNWAPFRYTPAAGWSSYPIDEYWNELGRRAALQFADETDAELKLGKQTVAQLLYLTLYQGAANVVEENFYALHRSYQTGDKPLGASIVGIVSIGIKFLVNQYFMYLLDHYAAVALRTLAQFVKTSLMGGLATLRGWIQVGMLYTTLLRVSALERVKVAVVGGLAVLAIAGLIVLAVFMIKGFLAGNKGWKIAASVIVGAIVFVLIVVMPIKTVITLAGTILPAGVSLASVAGLKALGGVLSANSEVLGTSAKAGIVGLIIAIGVAVGIFIYAMVTGGIKWGGVAFQMLLAQTIAAIIYAVIMFVLNLSVIGTIITALLAVIDLILILAGAGFSISGWVTEMIGKFLYHYDLMINPSTDMGQLNMELVNPDKGLTAGNQLKFSMVMTTVITNTNPGVQNFAYVDLWTEERLRSTTFKYEMDMRTITDTGLSASLNQTPPERWQVSPAQKFLGHQMHRGVVTDSIAGVVTLPAAGVNRTMPLNLNTAFALPGVSCWIIPLILPFPPFYAAIPVCFPQSVDGKDSVPMGQSIVLDVYPTNLDQFARMNEWCEGCTAKDVDGDGLISRAYGGNDPDDTKWDTDGDGLADGYELEMRSRSAAEGGMALDPENPDTDADGLNDAEEVRLGTNPANWDTDGDGISDKQELDGYIFTYASNKTTRIFSDPLQADADGDGMDDLYERTLHTCPPELGCNPLDNPYNPNVWNPSPIAAYGHMSDSDGIVIPGQTLAYTLTVQNNLKMDLAARGAANVGLPPKVSGAPLDMSFDLLKSQSQSIAPQLTVASSAGNVSTTLTNTMSSQLHTPSLWAWDAAQSGSRSTTTTGRAIAIAPVSGWSAPYVVVTLEAGGVSTVSYAYQATATGLASSSVRMDTDPIYYGVRYTAPPDVACADNGVCLVALAGWKSSYNAGYIFANRVTTNLGGPASSVMYTLSADTINALSVATDGTDFIVAWRETGTGKIKVQRVRNSGSLYGSVEQLDIGTGSVDLALADQRYIAVWPKSGSIWGAYVSKIAGFNTPAPVTAASTTFQMCAASAQLLDEISPEQPGESTPEQPLAVSPEQAPTLQLDPVTQAQASTAPQELASVAIGLNSKPVVAFDPASRRVLLLYHNLLGGTTSLRGRTLSGASSSPEFTLESNVLETLYAAASVDPVNGGWVVAGNKLDGSTFYQAVAPDGSLRGAKQTVATQSLAGVGMACAAPRPLLHLAFDENSGATTFADSSGYGHNATCSGNQCPLAGVGGKFGNAISLDGSNDALKVYVTVPRDGYAVSLWFKTDCPNCSLFSLGAGSGIPPATGSHSTIYLSNGNICTRLWDIQTICTAGTNWADSAWHQVVHTHGTALGGQRIYVDGKQQATGDKAVSDFDWQDSVVIGFSYDGSNDYFDGYIDDVKVYGRALSAGEVSDSYSAALVVLPFDEPNGSYSFVNAAHNGYNASCQYNCPTAGQAGKAYAAVKLDGANSVQVANQPVIVTEYSYDFESAPGPGWSPSSRASNSSSAPRSTTYLGQFANDTVSLNLTDLPAHDQVEIEFDLYLISSWDGNRTDVGPDYWEWGVDGAKQLKTTFSNAPDSCGNWQAYPGEPSTSGGILLSRDLSGGYCTGTSEWFTADDSDLKDNTIGNDKAKCLGGSSDTVGVIYQDTSYGGKSRLVDIARNCQTGDTWNFGLSSIRVWKAGQRPRTGAIENNTLGYGQDAVYHFSKTIDGHTAQSLSLYFKAWNLEGVGNEIWGLDNVRIKIKSRNVPLANSSFTVAAWAQHTRSGYSDFFVGQGWTDTDRNLHLGFRSTNKFTCGFGGDDLDTTATYAYDTDWHHWACTYDASTRQRKLYRDGELVASGTATGNYRGYGTLSLGSGAGAYFMGKLDETAIWDQALSADQIKTLYQKVKVMDDSVTECLMPYVYASSTSSIGSSGLALRQTTTFLGNNNQQNKIPLTIDADTPSSQPTSLRDGQYVGVTGTLIIGGVASDFAELSKVEVSVGGGAWQTVSGGRSWAYDWNTGSLPDGSYNLRTRATDAVGHVEAPGAGINVILDRQAPQPTTSIRNYNILTATLDAQGRWVVPLYGTVTDPPAGSSPGSGVRSVEVLLEGHEAVAGRTWQQAQLSGSNWSLKYVLPFVNNTSQSMPNPTGEYLFVIRATDQAGNQTPQDLLPAVLIRADNTAPGGRLFNTGPSTTISTTLTLGGRVTETGSVVTGVSQLQIGFVPAEQVDIGSQATVLLQLDEPAGAQRFDDASGQANRAACGGLLPQAQIRFDELGASFGDSSGHGLNATCTGMPALGFYHFEENAGAYSFADATGNGYTAECYGSYCPTAGVTGQFGRGLQFSGSAKYLRPVNSRTGMTVGGVKPFSLAAWVKPQSGGRTIISRGDSYHDEYSLMVRSDGKIAFHREATSGDLVTQSSIRFGQWSHVAAAYDGVNMRIYINGQRAAMQQSGALTSYVNSDVWIGASYRYYGLIGVFDGVMDEVGIYGQSLSDAQVVALYQSNSVPGPTCPTGGLGGRVGAAVAFDGVDDTVSVPDSNGIDFAYNQDFAVAAWIKASPDQPDMDYGDNDIIEKWNGSGGYPYVVRYLNAGSSTGKVQAARYDGARNPNIISSRPINDGEFHHVALVRRSGALYLYLDGVQDGTTADTTTGATTNSSPLYIGARGRVNGTPINYFAGLVDHLAIYNRGLTTDEVVGMYLNGFVPVCPAAGVSGKVDLAVHLDGSEGYLSVPYSPSLLPMTGTVAAWVKADATVSGQKLIVGQPQGRPELIITSAGKAAVQWRASDGTTPAAVGTTRVDNSQWHHLVGVWSPTALRIYVDGQLQGSATSTKSYTSSVASLQIGAANVTGYGGFFQGYIDQVVLYDRMLTAEEAQVLYQSGSMSWANTTLGASGAGVISTTWTHPVPTGLEGIYQINLRGIDTLGNRTTDRSTWNAWRGLVDTLAPRAAVTVTYQGTGSTARTSYDLWAQDFDLSESTFASPCPSDTFQRTTYDQVSSWYRSVTTDTTRLYRIQASCSKAGHIYDPPNVHACDVFQHCVDQGLVLLMAQRAFALDSLDLDVAVLTPTVSSVLLTTAPISITGGAFAVNYLRTLTVTVDSAPIQTFNWGSSTVTDTFWAANWTPSGEGQHVIKAILKDWAGSSMTSQPVTVTLGNYSAWS